MGCPLSRSFVLPRIARLIPPPPRDATSPAVVEGIKSAARMKMREVRPFSGRLTIGPATPDDQKADIEAYQLEVKEAYARVLKTTVAALEDSQKEVPLWVYQVVSKPWRNAH